MADRGPPQAEGGPRVIRVLAPNPGPFTLEGTNTWIAGAEPALVIDPGPDEAPHLALVAARAGPIAAILLTHHHPDHAPGAARLAGLAGAPVLASHPKEGERALADGQVLEGGGVRLRAVYAPGHSWDHVVFHEAAAGALFTGDAVLGRGTSVIDPPEGDLAAYLRSLDAMLALGARSLYPGHGPVVHDASAKLEEYRQHRLERERHVLEGLRSGPRTPVELVSEIYRDYPEELHPVAARSVLAHLIKLEREGMVERLDRGESGPYRLAPPPGR
jgi:glyoxylase-like metal-dependent hydrolase (beta-lactamase superfamily II)